MKRNLTGAQYVQLYLALALVLRRKDPDIADTVRMIEREMVGYPKQLVAAAKVGVNDMLRFHEPILGEDLRLLNLELARRGVPEFPDITAAAEEGFQKIIRRGKITTRSEYEAVSDLLTGPSELDDASTAKLASLKGEYELKRRARKAKR